MKRSSNLQNGLIWFGAGVSIAEILTGTYIAPLGMKRGLAAILLGHVIGCLLLFLAGYIGARTRRSAMETVKMSFGQRGGLLFSLLNVLQLAGWTAIMIYDGAQACNGILRAGAWVWALVIGALICLWLMLGVTNLGRVNQVTMLALFILSLILFRTVFFGGGSAAAGAGEISFGAAVELSVAMPLSWLPLISDYTREAEHPLGATLASTLSYGAASCWMYVIGMGAAIFTGEGDVAAIMVKAGLGVAALLILVLSTVTTTFLDAWSAGISSESLSGKLKGKQVALAVTVLGVVLAAALPMDDITDFLYLIGSVFAPMVAVQIADWFILKRDCFDRRFDARNLIIWALGFLLYRALMRVDIFVGCTLPDMAAVAALCVVAEKFERGRAKRA